MSGQTWWILADLSEFILGAQWCIFTRKLFQSVTLTWKMRRIVIRFVDRFSAEVVTGSQTLHVFPTYHLEKKKYNNKRERGSMEIGERF